MTGCLWVGFNTSLLVSSGFGVPFASRLIRFLYVAEFNFRVPHPCWFAMAAFRWKVWTSETNGNINIHFIFRSTAINRPKLHDKLKDPQQHVFKSVLTRSHGGGLDGEKTDSNISARGRYWLLPRYPQHMKFVTIYSLAGWKQQCNMPYHLPYPFLKRRLEKCRRIGVLGWSIDKIYPPMVRSEESIS